MPRRARRLETPLIRVLGPETDTGVETEMPQSFRVSLRNRVLLLITLASSITYLDRVCLSAAAPAIMRDLRLSSMQMGYAFSVFSLAYGIFEIPTGWLGDRLGQRKMITRIVACWSAFTALTGMVGGYLGLLVVRFAFGAAEAGAFPSMAAALARWFQTTDRARATGTMWMGTRLGAAIGIPLATLLMGWFGWRLTFAFFGAIGGVWCIFFWRWYRDNPARHPALDPSDLTYLGHNVDPPSSPGPPVSRGSACSRAQIYGPSFGCISRHPTDFGFC